MGRILRKITANNANHTHSAHTVGSALLAQPNAVSEANHNTKDLRLTPSQNASFKSAPSHSVKSLAVARRGDIKSSTTRYVKEEVARDAYQVGYCKPPVQTQFKKGKSGNPKGRSKGSKNISTLLENAGQKLVTISDDGRTRRITMQDLIVRGLVTKAAKGDTRAVQNYLKLMEKCVGLGEDKPLGDTSQKQTPYDTERDQKILEQCGFLPFVEDET
jgi:hypothetical protein